MHLLFFYLEQVQGQVMLSSEYKVVKFNKYIKNS